MALERQSIEKKDFPIGRRGYDPDAVDAHLASIAEQVEELRRSARRRTETLASAASEQVRAIVEAAESSAAEIQRQAEDEASEIRSEARREAEDTREQATATAREYVGRVSESTATMLQRIEAMESELGALLEALRTGSNRLGADLQLLEGNLSEVREAVAPRGRFEPEPTAPSPALRSAFEASPPAAAPAPSPSPPAPALRAVEPEPVSPAPAPSVAHGDELFEETSAGLGSSPARAGAGAHDEDVEGARLIALNMALNGSSRAETDRYLAENFQLSDRRGLLDEVYASVEG